MRCEGSVVLEVLHQIPAFAGMTLQKGGMTLQKGGMTLQKGGMTLEKEG